MAVPREMTSPGSSPEAGTGTVPCPGLDLKVLPSGLTHEGSRFWQGLPGGLPLIREPMSGLTHCIGALFSAAGACLLFNEALNPFRPWHLTGYTVFGTAMVLLYVVSTLFHWLPLSSQGILRMRRLDHIMIFVFIAATYTPFCLVPFRGPFGWTVFACIWVIAALGAVFKFFWLHVPKRLCVMLYLFAGGFSLVGIGPILQTLQPWAIFWLAAGGLAYCIGAVFYVLDGNGETPPLFGYHEVFHLFVMLGSSAHFWVIYRYVNAFD
ncbi:MAG: hemolysin III family protein [Desulfobacterota bacterium]|nr:hemolysin III family protein [Thermodesulfobacteriota bacterium]